MSGEWPLTHQHEDDRRSVVSIGPSSSVVADCVQRLQNAGYDPDQVADMMGAIQAGVSRRNAIPLLPSYGHGGDAQQRTSVAVPKSRRLAVDVQNMARIFYEEPKERTNPWTMVNAMEHRAAEFVKLLKKSHMHVVGALGGDTRDDVSDWKFTSGTRKQIEMEQRQPLCTQILLNECLRKAGATICRPLGVLPKDALAAIGFSQGGQGVLSRDSHFLSYKQSLVVFNGYRTIGSGRNTYLELARVDAGINPARTRATLQRLEAQGKTRPEINPAIAEQVLARSADREHYANIVSKIVPGRGVSKKTWGSSSSSDKRLGNLHAKIAPLRAAARARWNWPKEGDRLQEFVPVWRRGRDPAVEWEELPVAEVNADLDKLLDDPFAAVKWLAEQDEKCACHWPNEPEEAAWRETERHYNRCVMVAEACAVAQKSPVMLLDILMLFKEFQNAHPTPKQRALPNQYPELECARCHSLFDAWPTGFQGQLVDMNQPVCHLCTIRRQAHA
eukprot:GDKI01005497.1.p1 GENE.GDKI01005497.1~~GDKI01005497.1.p1  ORF type:complete len:502 (+),score=89.82 GDKI01005497.1:184-1689(+)